MVRSTLIGKNSVISNKVSMYGDIEVGDNVRIDDFCILSGTIKIGNNVHIAAGVYLYGGGGIEIKDFAQIGAKSTLHSASDDFSGEYLVGPTNQNTNVKSAPIVLEEYAVLGANCVVLPGVTIGKNTAVGAMSLVNKSLPENSIYGGSPARFLKDRKQLVEHLPHSEFENQIEWHKESTK
jgi:galactoside O-acetyltransferase